MGFNGGGGGQLQNHRHDGSIPLDGGPLSFLNITQSGMSAGSLCFSDGAHLQERAIGAASNVLTVAGGVPTWAAAAAPTVAYWELLDQHAVNNSTNETTYTKTFSPVLDMMDGGDYNALYCCGTGRGTGQINFQCKLNGYTDYSTNYNQNAAGTLTGVTDASATEIDIVPIAIMAPAGSFPFNFGFYIAGSFAAAAGDDRDLIYYGFSGTNTSFTTFHGQTVNDTNNDISTIQFLADVNAYTGSVFSIYGIKQ